jgi:hypothetical protein
VYLLRQSGRLQHTSPWPLAGKCPPRYYLTI